MASNYSLRNHLNGSGSTNVDIELCLINFKLTLHLLPYEAGSVS